MQKSRAGLDKKKPRKIKDSKEKWQARARGVEFSDYQVEQTLFSLFSPESGKGKMGRLWNDKKKKLSFYLDCVFTSCADFVNVHFRFGHPDVLL